LSAGVAVPAAAGIPLNHRGLSGSAAFVTAHHLGDDDAGDAVRARIAQLARGADTLVIFMAGAELEAVRRTLLEAGLPPATPAALIEGGTLPEQRVARGTLGTLPELLEPNRGGPVLVVVGKTVDLNVANADAHAAPRRAVKIRKRVG
jgi:uroporphyrin-III C-methyltransferase